MTAREFPEHAKRKGIELDFISWVNRDGSGTVPVDSEHLETLQDECFGLVCLSITERTYIAHGFNTFVVRIKK